MASESKFLLESKLCISDCQLWNDGATKPDITSFLSKVA